MKNAEDSTLVMLEVIEQEMVLMWRENEIPILLKEDEEFVETIIHSIMLEKNYWQQIMQIGEA